MNNWHKRIVEASVLMRSEIRHVLLMAVLLLILPLVLATPAASIYAGIFGAGVLVACFARQVLARTLSWRDAAVLTLAVLGIAGVSGSAITSDSAQQAGRLVYGLALFVIVSHQPITHNGARLWLLGITALLAALCLIAPGVVAWMNDKLFLPSTLYAAMPRLQVGDTANPNVFTGTLALLAPCALGLLLDAVWRADALHSVTRWAQGAFAGAVLIATLVMSFLSQSRAGLIAMVFGLVIMIVLLKPRVLPVLLGAGAAVVLVMGLLAGDAARHHWAKLFIASPNSPQSAPEANAIDKRFELWGRGIDLVLAHPIAGIGLGQFQVQAAQRRYVFNLPNIPHAHNLLLQIAVDVGMAGLLAWLFLMSTSVISAWQLRRCPSIPIRLLAVAALGGLAAALLHGMVDATLWGMTRPAVLLWLMMGVAGARNGCAVCAIS